MRVPTVRCAPWRSVSSGSGGAGWSWAQAGVKEIARPRVFSVTAKEWLKTNEAHWSASNRRIEGYNVDHLLPHFGRMLLTDITADDIARYQAARKATEASGRTINMEVGTLRSILRRHRLWANLQPDVRMHKTREDVGRALGADEQHRLLTACRKSRSRSLYPAVLLSLHTGLRNGELRQLCWHQLDLMERTLTVGRSKTRGGEGRVIPLSRLSSECMQEWRSRFPDAEPSHCVFPSERYGLDGANGLKDGKAVPYEIRPSVPIGSWKVAWTAARETARVDCRWHDLRHTFVSTLAEGQASDTTIMDLAGHVSRRMMKRYSHTGNAAKRAAVSAFDRPACGTAEERVGTPTGQNGSPQNHPQSGGKATDVAM